MFISRYFRKKYSVSLTILDEISLHNQNSLFRYCCVAREPRNNRAPLRMEATVRFRSSIGVTVFFENQEKNASFRNFSVQQSTYVYSRIININLTPQLTKVTSANANLTPSEESIQTCKNYVSS